MTKGSLKIHSENILPIIKKWLYSDKDIFVRELISNACDAIRKIKILESQGEAPLSQQEVRIDLNIDKTNKTLKFIDTGIGMDKEEVEKYIAQIAFSGAEDFLNKYKTNNEKDQIIGHFGLGFYSAYMAAYKVEIETLSYKQGAPAVLWSCEGSADYEIQDSSKKERGTEITLFIGEDSEEFLDKNHLKRILKHYCSFLPYPIYLDGEHINQKEPLWMKNPLECSDKDYLEFYHLLYSQEGDPLFWVHLNIDFPFHLRGILYFPKIHSNFDFQRNAIKLFCNRVFVTDNCKDLVPDYLLVLRGALDSAELPLNVSRSYLQMDKTVRQLSQHISKKISDHLAQIYKTDRERFLKFWPEVSMLIKLGVIQDDKFYSRVKSFLLWNNLKGEWTTAQDYLERNKDKSPDKIFYTHNRSKDSQILKMYSDQGIEVLVADAYIDPPFINTLEKHLSPALFQRIDSEIDAALLDPSREKTVLDTQGHTEAGHIANQIKAALGGKALEVEAKSLSNDNLPGFVTIDENSRRMRDYFRMTQSKKENGNLADSLIKRTFVVNTNNKLVLAAVKMGEKNPELAKELAEHLYDMALFSQHELTLEDMPGFIERNNRVLSMLISQMHEPS